MPNRLIAIGDIHGCFEPIKVLVEEEIKLSKSDELVFLGDYIDRGAKSKEVIDYIIKLIEDGFKIIPLRGNHEEMLLNAHKNPDDLSLWLFNGGDKTLRSFGINHPNELKEKYLRFFENLEYYYPKNEFLFVHAGFNDKIDNPFNDKYSMIWECRRKYKHPELRNKIIVHGHCITTRREFDKRTRKNPNVIPLDSGCVYNYRGYGKLTATELFTRQIFQVDCLGFTN